jgi:hypothetical protein
MIPTLISVTAVIIAAFSLFVTSERFRLDLYNKRFEIYLRTVKFYQALMKSEEGDEDRFRALQTDFIIASREAQFLFGSDSGVYDLLSQLNKASFQITGLRKLPEGMSREDVTGFNKQFSDALALWNSSMEPLEARMAPYLSYHYASALSALLGQGRSLWHRARRRIKR